MHDTYKPPFHTPPPPKLTGILQDAGELEVRTHDSGYTRHRFAMVVAFDSEVALRQAIAAHWCAYRNGQAIQERIHE